MKKYKLLIKDFSFNECMILKHSKPNYYIKSELKNKKFSVHVKTLKYDTELNYNYLSSDKMSYT